MNWGRRSSSAQQERRESTADVHLTSGVPSDI